MTDFLTRISHYSPKQLTVLAGQLWKKLEESENARREPVAIIGMACRFPGAPNLDAFWSLLRDGVDAVGEVPPARWNIDQYYDPDPDVPGKMYTRYGAFLENVDQFDARFFGIAPREALSMDPQQRLLLEVTWEALEHAGLPPRRLVGSRTAVFIGIGASTYTRRLVGDPRKLDAYSGTGNASSVACGRLSYLLDLRGPNFPIDTACSSSLVAVDVACTHLRNDECRLAIAGGVNLLLVPESTLYFCKMRALSPDGRCRAFDAGASGYGRGEGCGVVVLKLLSRALADGDSVLALIRGSAVNHDGHSNGLTVPNPQAQEAVIREAWKRAGVGAGQVGYLEAHGTGTPLGDPVEMRAIGTLLDGSQRSAPLQVGSVKTNFGHLEWAAGIAGLMKVVLALRHGEIPPHLHFRHPNPYIPWGQLPVEIATELRCWPTIEGRRIAGISSFGFSGTNAHVVLEHAPTAEPLHDQTAWPAHLFCLSAKTDTALKQTAVELATRLSADDSLALPSVCYTANTARSHFEHRLAVVAETVEQVRERLSALAADRLDAKQGARVIRAAETPKLAFLFAGQGSSYVGMGRQLYETQPRFKQTLEKCNEILGPYLQTPLLSVLYPEEGSTSQLDQPSYGQPAIFALEYALAKLWANWGIEPAIVLGHSLGEYVAACIAGVFTLEDGLKLVAQRGRLMQSRLQPGAMAAVFAAESVVAPIIAPYADQLAIACLNGPENTVISGGEPSVQAAIQEFSARRIHCRRLDVSLAFHSPLMEPILGEFETLARQIRYSCPRMGLLSNVTGRLAEGDEMSNAAYWCRQLRQPVHFAKAMQTLAERGYELFVEIGPSTILSGIAQACVPDARRQWLPSLSCNRGHWKQMLQTLQSLYLRGVDVDWHGFYRGCRLARISLPTYPFERQRYWLPMPEVGAQDALPQAPSGKHGVPVLPGERLESPALNGTIFQTYFTIQWPGSLCGRRAGRTAMAPLASLIAMVLAAAEELFGRRGVVLEDVACPQPMMLRDEEARRVQLLVRPRSGAVSSLEIYSRPENHREGTWTLHLEGVICGDTEETTGAESVPEADQLVRRCQARRNDQQADVHAFCATTSGENTEAPPHAPRIERIDSGTGEGLARILISPVTAKTTHSPAAELIDAWFAPLADALSQKQAGGDAFEPIGFQSLQFHGITGSALLTRAVLQADGSSRGTDDGDSGCAAADITVLDESGRLVAVIEGVRARRSAPRNLDLTPGLNLPAEIAVSDECRRLRAAVLECPAEDRQDFLESYLAQRLAQITGTEPEAVDHDQPLTGMGLDSLMAMEFRQAIESGLQISVPLASLLEGVTLSTLTARLLKAMFETPEGLAPSAGWPAGPSNAQNVARDDVGDGGPLLEDEEIQGLSDEEVESALHRILSERSEVAS